MASPRKHNAAARDPLHQDDRHFPPPGEQLVPIVEAAASIGLCIHARTALRWANHGRHGMRLRSVKIRRARCTTVNEMRRWIDAIHRHQQEVQAAPCLDEATATHVLRAHGLPAASRTRNRLPA